ncbi:MAG: YIP1 family protein, partial [Candidatus Latescibacterota bacterium]|nr:YIP1 family protein [Candidatus Latescibacterota bacterium]
DWVIDSQKGSFTDQDLTEIYIDADHSGGDAANMQMQWSKDAQQYTMIAGPSRLYGLSSVDNNPMLNAGDTRASGVYAASLRVGQYTVYEWAIPLWSSFPDQRYSIEPGAVIGFDAVVTDADGDEPGNWVAWTAGALKLANSDRLGDLVLVNNYDGLDMDLQPTLPADLQIAYGALARISGRVLRNGTDEGWSDVGVQLLTAAGQPISSARTDSAGYYEIWTVAGSYQLSTLSPANSEVLMLEVTAGQRRERADLATEFARISGRVTNPEGAPWIRFTVAVQGSADGEVSVEEARQFYHADGSYMLSLAPGSYEISIADSEGAEPCQVVLESGDHIKEVHFTPENVEFIDEFGELFALPERGMPLPLVVLTSGVCLLGLMALVPLYRRRAALGGVLLAPAQTFRHLAAKPDWKGPLLMQLIYVLIPIVVLSNTLPIPGLEIPALGFLIGVVMFVCITLFITLFVVSLWMAETAVLWGLARLAVQALSFRAVLCSVGYANTPVLLASLFAIGTLLAGADPSSFDSSPPSSLGAFWPDLAGGDAVVKMLLDLIEPFWLWSLWLTVPALQAITALTPGRAKLVVIAHALIYVAAMVGFAAFGEMVSSITPSMISSP